MAVTGSVSVNFDFKNIGSSDDEQSTIAILKAIGSTFSDGTGALQLNKIWQDTLPLTDGQTITVDFSPTAASGASGAVTFAALKALVVYAPTTNTTNLTLSRAATTGISLFAADGDALAPLKPGGMLVFTDPSAAGMTMAAGDTDVLTIVNSAGAAATVVILAAGI